MSAERIVDGESPEALLEESGAKTFSRREYLLVEWCQDLAHSVRTCRRMLDEQDAREDANRQKLIDELKASLNESDYIAKEQGA